ncbi:MAG TPA: thiol:disulfide interchange protein DsbA/DsbL [Steroidobacteraceae bacterium]|nr:thiol:disulfide interchange protein DsbA/DsbL [Steroidobacteraceae bacterium]
MIRSVAVAALLLAGCSQSPPPPAPAPASPQAALPPAAPPATPAATAQSETEQATASQESGDADEHQAKSDASLEKIAGAASGAQLPAGKWQPGLNYDPLVPAQPTSVAPGKVEVLEIFWLACPHCYALEPYVNSWLKTKPANVDFVRVPVVWQDVHRAHARLFYTLQALGKEDALHAKVLSAIFDQRNQLFVPGDAAATQSAQVAFAKANGISEADFLKAYNSFSVQNSLQKAEDIQSRYLIDAVPRFIVNGKYSTDVAMAGGGKQEGAEDKLFALLDDLVASEKHH